MHSGVFLVHERLLRRVLSGELVMAVKLGFTMIIGCLVRIGVELFLHALIYHIFDCEVFKNECTIHLIGVVFKNEVFRIIFDLPHIINFPFAYFCDKFFK